MYCITAKHTRAADCVLTPSIANHEPFVQHGRRFLTQTARLWINRTSNSLSRVPISDDRQCESSPRQDGGASGRRPASFVRLGRARALFAALLRKMALVASFVLDPREVALEASFVSHGSARAERAKHRPLLAPTVSARTCLVVRASFPKPSTPRARRFPAVVQHTYTPQSHSWNIGSRKCMIHISQIW